MFYIALGFVFGLFVPYMARRFAKFMPATPAYALYRLFKPNKHSHRSRPRHKKLKLLYLTRSVLYAFITAFLTACVIYHIEDYVAWYIGFIWVLILLSEIDLKMFLLPDILTVPLLISGFMFSAFEGGIQPEESAFAALAGYLLPIIATLLMLWRSVDAFGGGDIKLLAAIGAWLGFEPLIYTIILSCLIFGIYSLIKKQRSGAFGPSIALSAIIILLLY